MGAGVCSEFLLYLAWSAVSLTAHVKHKLLQPADVPPLLVTELHTRYNMHPLWKEAEPAFGLVMDVARRFSAADRFVRRGDWLKSPYPLTTNISGKRLGILGPDCIGQVVARCASDFDMEVCCHNRRPNCIKPANADTFCGLFHV